MKKYILVLAINEKVHIIITARKWQCLHDLLRIFDLKLESMEKHALWKQLTLWEKRQ